MTERVYLKEMWLEIVGQSRAVRAEMAAVRGMDRWKLWQKKRAIGADARAVHLARMLLKGSAYALVEPVFDEVHNPLPLGAVAFHAGVTHADVAAWVAGNTQAKVAA